MSPNPLGIPVLTLPGPLPPATVIAAADLDSRSDAAKLREQAVAELEQARQEADALREAVLREAEREIEQLKRQARDTAVANAVQWLCQEQEMEQLIASQLTMRWRGLTARVLDKLLGKSDQNEFLLRRVEREVEELLPHGRLTLCVEPAALMTATQAYTGTPEITVVADAELVPGQARLDNGLVHIYLDERAYRTRLLQQLAGQTERMVYA